MKQGVICASVSVIFLVVGPSPADREIYRSTDEQGVVNGTDRWDSIPKRYQSQAKRLPL